MIKCNMGTLEASGNAVTLMSEATLILSKVSEIIAKELPIDKTKEEIMAQIVRTIKETDEMKEEN